MKKFYFFILISFSAISFSQNIVVNQTFADGLNGWSSTGTGYGLPTHITDDGQDDSFSVKYVATATTGFDQRFNVVPGATVTVSFWYKAARTNGATTGNTARIWSVFQDSTSATPTTPINPPGTTSASDDPLRNSGTYLPQAATWTQVTVNSEVPVGANTFLMQFRAYNGATISFDNISFVSPGATLSNDGLQQISGLTVYPNPVKDGILYINTNNNVEKNVTVYDVSGKVVLESVVNNNTLNVSNLKSGIYFANINENGITETKKIIIE